MTEKTAPSLIGAPGVMTSLLAGHRGPFLEFCRAMPPPAIVPLAILFLGYDERMKLSIVAISAMWPILLNTSSAIQHIHPILLDVSTSLRLSVFERVRLIVIPSVVPAILLGIRIALPLTIVLTLLVEILTSIEGIGALMIAAQRNFQSGQVYGLLVLVGMFGFLLNNAFSIAEGRSRITRMYVYHWRAPANGTFDAGLVRIAARALRASRRCSKR